MENACLNQNIFGRLEDPEDLYRNYFDDKGEIQIGWVYDGSYDMKEIMETAKISGKGQIMILCICTQQAEAKSRR